jgi:CarD family transcriptional regulator
MAQKKKTQSKVRTPKAATAAVKKAPAKTTKAKTVTTKAKTVKPAAAAAKKASKSTEKVSAKKRAAKAPGNKTAVLKPADVKAVETRAAAASKKPGATKKVAVSNAPAPAKTAAPKAAAKPAAAKAPAAVKPAVVAAAVKSAKGKSAAQRAVAASVPPGEKISAPAAAKPQEKKGQRHGFKLNEYVVYPAHGVGRIVGIEEQEIAGHSLELFVITFDKEKLTLRVPIGKLETVGMRKLSEADAVKKAMDTLKGRARVKRTMWSRRAQEYVAKINSGSLVSIAEVVRDLYRSEAQPEQSYSERQLYEDALDRMARELAAVENLDERGAIQRITEVLSKSARGRRAAAEAAAEAEGEAEEVEAA